MIERIIERSIYACRWLLAPIYLGMSIALMALTVKFFQELYHFIPAILEMSEGGVNVEITCLY